MRLLPVLAVVGLALGWPPTPSAQTAPPAPTSLAMRVTAARKANATLMRQYSWTSRTEVIDQGQVKDLRLDTVTYGPDGQLQRTVMNDQSAPLPFGFLRRRIAKVQDFMSRATATGPDASGLFEMTGQNVVYAGDTFSVWVNPRTRHVQRIQVSTTFQGDPVSLTATFKTLPSGLNHVAFAEVIAPAKQLSVQVQNFDYNRNN